MLNYCRIEDEMRRTQSEYPAMPLTSYVEDGSFHEDVLTETQRIRLLVRKIEA